MEACNELPLVNDSESPYNRYLNRYRNYGGVETTIPATSGPAGSVTENAGGSAKQDASPQMQDDIRTMSPIQATNAAPGTTQQTATAPPAAKKASFPWWIILLIPVGFMAAGERKTGK